MNAVTSTLTAERPVSDSFEVVRTEANLGAEIRGLDSLARSRPNSPS